MQSRVKLRKKQEDKELEDNYLASRKLQKETTIIKAMVKV